jgi:hypothetical protein
MAQIVQCLLNNHEVLSSNPSAAKKKKRIVLWEIGPLKINK